MKNKFLHLFILISIIVSQPALSQNCLDILFHNKLYSNSDDIINGEKWVYEKKYRGTPLLIDNYWPSADILYKGIHYTGILVNYDLFKNELIIYHPEKGNEKYVVINKDNLSGFSFTDSLSNRKYLYEYTELPGIKGKTLYRNASAGKSLLYIKYIKNVEIKSADMGIGEYTGYYEYYLDMGNGFNNFRSKKQFLKLLLNHTSELSRFIRKNRYKINSKNPENVIAVLIYFNGLK